MANWVFPKRIALAKYKMFGEMFGKLEWRITRSQVFTTYEGQIKRRGYEILWADEWSAVLYFRATRKEKDRCRHLFFDFDADCMYFAAGRAGNCEYFRRVMTQ